MQTRAYSIWSAPHRDFTVATSAILDVEPGAKAHREAVSAGRQPHLPAHVRHRGGSGGSGGRAGMPEAAGAGGGEAGGADEGTGGSPGIGGMPGGGA